VHALAHETDAPLTGYLIYEIETRPSTPMRRGETRAILHVISVDATHRGQGVGSALIQAMRAELDPEAVQTIATTYATFNTPSAALMARAGFEPKLIVAEWRL
jgi:aminoglycoside 3-N-acetyltransferase I